MRFVRGISLLVTCVIFGCGHSQAAPGDRSAPKADVVTRVGQTFEIRLPANPTTGYRWIVAPAVDEKIVHLAKQQYVRTGENMPGAGGEEVWTFKAMGPGTTEISMGYMRPWEMNTPIARTERFRVRVE